MEAKFKNETGIAKAQRDFDIKKGTKSALFSPWMDELNSIFAKKI